MYMFNYANVTDFFSLEISFKDVTDPVGDVTRFINSYEETLGTTHPTFYQGSYSQVT